jgi:hypothetical protein
MEENLHNSFTRTSWIVSDLGNILNRVNAPYWVIDMDNDRDVEKVTEGYYCNNESKFTNVKNKELIEFGRVITYNESKGKYTVK